MLEKEQISGDEVKDFVQKIQNINLQNMKIKQNYCRRASFIGQTARQSVTNNRSFIQKSDQDQEETEEKKEK